MLTPVRSSRFKRDVRRAKARGKDLAKLRSLLGSLTKQEKLKGRYRDHRLQGGWKGYREAHLESDWLVICRVHGDELQLARTGTHSDLFDD
ncbi:MAG: type II toxin-antitoxin system YafQ family toxin [Bryobacterales bacterium]|nr:type II toxin-antitoxin system YafQ family toxin [Bryobacterales bacterium]